MAESVALHVLVAGRVQGVGYRFFVKGAADRLGLCGWVRNLPEGDVEAFGEGPRAALEEWLLQLKKGPPMSHIRQIQVDWQTSAKAGKAFVILP